MKKGLAVTFVVALIAIMSLGAENAVTAKSQDLYPCIIYCDICNSNELCLCPDQRVVTCYEDCRGACGD